MDYKREAFAVRCLILDGAAFVILIEAADFVILNRADIVILNGAAGGVKDLKYLIASPHRYPQVSNGFDFSICPTRSRPLFRSLIPCHPFPLPVCSPCLGEWTIMVYSVSLRTSPEICAPKMLPGAYIECCRRISLEIPDSSLGSE